MVTMRQLLALLTFLLMVLTVLWVDQGPYQDLGVSEVTAPQTGQADWSGLPPSILATPEYFLEPVRSIFLTRLWPEPLPDLTVTMDIIDELRPQPPVPLPVIARKSHPLPPAHVETLIRRYFEPVDVEWALRVSYCESHWDATAKNPTSSASGLFQHLARFWDDRSMAAGWDGASIFDPVANTAVAAYLYYSGGPGHWDASRGCWG